MKQLLLRTDLSAPKIDVDKSTKHRLRKVLRLRAGAQITLADGTGRQRTGVWQGDFFEANGAVSNRSSETMRVTLAAGLLKGPRWQHLLEKCTEVGVDAIVPLRLDHCVATPKGDKDTAKVARWQAMVDEAFEQCGRVAVPTVSAPQTLGNWLSSNRDLLVVYGDESARTDDRASDASNGGVSNSVASDIERRSLQSIIAAGNTNHVAIVIGPEGGLSRDEVAALAAAGAQPISLSRNVLRAETAAIVATALVKEYAQRERSLGS